MTFIKNIHLYYQRITELFPQIINAYPENTEKFIFLGDLFYAFVIQNNIDIMTVEITPAFLDDYIAFYTKIKNLNMDNHEVIQEQDDYYKMKINSIMNTYNEYVINGPLKNPPEGGADGFVFHFGRFGVLQEILLSDISIHSIVGLPNTLKILHITHCILRQIDRIPPMVDYVNCAYNQVVRLPDMHHTTLKVLICNNNFLTKLPRLPDSTHRIFCNCNLIKGLPEYLPAQLRLLFCNNNRIRKMGTLPPRISILSCSHNYLKELSGVMHLQYLKILYCNNNLLEELPPLPMGIQEVNHNHNPIKNFFPYPTGIRVF